MDNQAERTCEQPKVIDSTICNVVIVWAYVVQHPSPSRMGGFGALPRRRFHSRMVSGQAQAQHYLIPRKIHYNSRHRQNFLGRALRRSTKQRTKLQFDT